MKELWNWGRRTGETNKKENQNWGKAMEGYNLEFLFHNYQFKSSFQKG